MADEAPIRWDIVEEHLDEAGFLVQLWEEALRSPLYTLAEIAEGPEERLLAHLDGLVLALPAAAERLLVPALAGDEPGQAFAAAFALADGGRPQDLDAVLDALAKAEPEPVAAIVRALGVVPRPEIEARLASEVLRAEEPLRGRLVEILAYRRVNPGVRLEPMFASPDPLDRARALRAARVFPALLDPRAVEQGLRDPDATVRAAALETGAILGMRAAQDACEAEVASRGEAFGTAALLLALSGDPRQVGPIAAALRDERFKASAAFALGFTGRVEAADALVEAMLRDEEVAPVAAEAFSLVTGLAIEKRLAKEPTRWTPDREDEEDEEEPYGPEADLPNPVPENVALWWKENRARLDTGQRLLRGGTWTSDAVLRELADGPARSRGGLALELAARSRGGALLSVDAPSRRQRAELADAVGEVHGGGRRLRTGG